MTEMLPEIKHGTPGGAQQHYLRGERPCDACRIANREYTRQWRREKRGYADKVVYRVGTLRSDGEPVYSQIFTNLDDVAEHLETVRVSVFNMWLEEAPPPRWMTH